MTANVIRSGPGLRVALLGLAALVGIAAGACDASDNEIDPADLEMRDLLGMSPQVAAAWDADQRAAARAVLRRGVAEPPTSSTIGDQLGLGVELDDRVAIALGQIDAQLAAGGVGAIGVVRVRIAELAFEADPVVVSLDADADDTADDTAADALPELLMSTAWQRPQIGATLDIRGEQLLVTLATDLGHERGPLVVVPAPRLSVAAAYVDAVPAGDHAGADGRAHLLVNPVVLAALEPTADEIAATAAIAAAGGAGGDEIATAAAARLLAEPGTTITPPPDTVSGANPYTFYGSIGECAYAEQLRCESCMAASDCVARTIDGDGNAECMAFAADTGLGYSLFCVNMAVSITGVEACVDDAAPGCAIDRNAVEDLAELTANANFVTETACSEALDVCLADIFGESEGTYPPPAGEDPVPPRNTSVGCGDSSSNCQADPSCNATGPSCNNSLSCDSTCADSSSQSGCGGCSDSCSSGSGGGGGGGSCISCEGGEPTGGSEGSSGCGSSGGSEGSSGCGDCGGSGGGSEGSSGCGSSGGSEGSSGCGGEGGGCSGGSCGGEGGGDSCGGGGGGGGCTIAKSRNSANALGLFIQLTWALLPIPAAAWVRRRSRRRKEKEKNDPDPDSSAASLRAALRSSDAAPGAGADPASRSDSNEVAS